MKYIGSPLPRQFDSYKVLGKSEYIQDIELQDIYYLVIIRSEIPHGIIEKLDYDKLKLRDSVKLVFSGKDTKFNRIGILKDQEPIKYPKVRSLGDEVLAIVTTDPDKIEKYIETDVEIKYTEFKPIFDPKDALDPKSPLVHEEIGTNVINVNFNIASGNVNEAFKNSDLVLEEEYKIPRVAFAPMGTLGAIAYIDSNNKLNLISNTQAPFQLKKELAEVLNVNPNIIKIVQPDIGGSFGRGMDMYPFEVLVSYAALKLKKPIKVIYSRFEDFSYSPTRQPAIINIKTGVKKDGKILARSVNVLLDSGAYVSWGIFDARVMGATTTGLYMINNVEFKATAVYTNNIYTINMRGAGNPQITFAIESHMDALANELGMDPLEFRLINAHEGKYITPQGMIIHDSKLRSCLKIAAESIGWKGSHKAGQTGNKRYGIGFSGIFHVGGGARVYRTDGCGIFIKIDDFGKVQIYTGYSEIGQGSAQSIMQIVASTLGVPMENVEIIFKGDSDIRPWDTATHASRTTFVCGNAALRASKRLKEIVLQEASRILGVDANLLEIDNGLIYSRENRNISIEFDKLIRRVHFREQGYTLYSYDYYDPPNEMLNRENKGNISATYVTGAQAALVEVDIDTGKIKVLKIISVHDVGKVINPLAAEGQIIGGIVQGLGHALYEELIFQNGRPINTSFGDYVVPTSSEIPDIEVKFLDTNDAEGPYGAKGLAEDGIIGIAAAIGNAIYDAVKVRIKELPLLPEKILKGLGGV